MKNLQTIEKRSTTTGLYLDVVDLWRTIQGEGPFAGRPAIFLRLAGCNLQCPLCDTDYTSHRETVHIDRLVELIGKASCGIIDRYHKGVEQFVGDGDTDVNLVVVTGGEPFRQSCGPLTRKLLNDGYSVQFETNGTLFDDSIFNDSYLRDSVTVVCSPKAAVNGVLQRFVTAYKYVLRDGAVDPSDGLPTVALDSKGRPARPPKDFKGTVYIQPCDEGPETREGDGPTFDKNLRAAILSCMQYGYTLCVQVHKLIGMP